MSNGSRPLDVSVQQMLDHLLEGAIITDLDGTILAVNSHFSTITGYSTSEVIGQTPRLLKSGLQTDSFYSKLWKSLKEKGSWEGEIYNKRKDGEIYSQWLRIITITNEEGAPYRYLALFADITQKKRLEDVVNRIAYTDPLTDLPNRLLFHDRLTQAIAHTKRHRSLLAVLFINIDRLKAINDTMGHDMGDKIIKGVAQRLTLCLREGDTVGRLGGDEFLLVLPGLKEMNDVLKITEKILDAIKIPFHISEQDIYNTASIGISVFPYDGDDADSLIKNADKAMSRAKMSGRNNYQFFTAAMKADIHEQLLLEQSMRRALERKEFVVYYQPQIDLTSGEIIGSEALVRWQHPELGLVPPTKFIRWAEESGLIVELGEWVLRTACRQNRQWQMMGYGHLRIAVNISACQFRQGNLVQTVTNVLKETGLSPECLELELTESVIMESAGPAVDIPHELKALGVRFSIDDFGTGYSSLSYLKRFPVNTLKIDRSFISDLTSNSHDATIAQAVIALGHGLNLAVLAEGVETEPQLEFLRSLRCDRMQGYYFSEPIPAQKFEQLLLEKRCLNEDTLFEKT